MKEGKKFGFNVGQMTFDGRIGDCSRNTCKMIGLCVGRGSGTQEGLSRMKKDGCPYVYEVEVTHPEKK